MKKLLLILSVVISTAGFGASTKTKKLAVTGLVTIPHVANLGVDYRLGSKISLGVTGGYVGVNFSSNGYPFSITTANIEGRLRLHPFSGAFFVGVGVGTRNMTAEAKGDVTSSGITVNVTGHCEISNGYIIPHLGWFRTAANGFTLGFEMGAYVPHSPNSAVTLTSDNPLIALVQSTQGYQDLQTSSQNFSNDMASKLLPYVALRLGWAF